MKSVYLKLALLFLCLGPPAAAHNMKLTTAQVTLRSETHVSIRIETNMTKLTGRIDWPGKPRTILELAGADDDQILALRAAIIDTFDAKMPIEVGGRRLQSQQVRIANVEEFKTALQSVIAHQIIPDTAGHRDAHSDDHSDLIIQIDGFIDASAENRNIQIDFPAALGPMSISYFRPRTKTLMAGEITTRYVETMD